MTKKPKIRPWLTDGEKRAWLATFRAMARGYVVKPETLHELADVLQAEWFGGRGNRPPTDAARWVHNMRARHVYGQEVTRELEAMEAAGEKPVEDRAIKIVAERHRITPDALRKRMQPKTRRNMARK